MSRPVVVWLAGVDWDAVRGTDRHLAERLGRDVGRDVVWVDPPLSLGTVVRRRRWRRLVAPVRVSAAAPRVVRVSVVSPPWAERRGVRAVTASWSAIVLRLVLVARRLRVTAVVATSPMVPFAVAPRGRRLYYATDDFVAGAGLMGRSSSLVAAAERRRLAEADLLVAVSPEIAGRWGRPAAVLPNGVDAAGLASVRSVGGAVAGMVGQFNARIDLGLLEAVAERPVEVLLVGPVVEGVDRVRFDRLVARPNVTWTGPQPHEAVAGHLARMAVGMTPYADSGFNRASVPLKTLEYLAAGCAVVSTPLPSAGRLPAGLVAIAAGPELFADEVQQAIAVPDGVRRDRGRGFAARHDWSVRARALCRLLDRDAPGR